MEAGRGGRRSHSLLLSWIAPQVRRDRVAHVFGAELAHSGLDDVGRAKSGAENIAYGWFDARGGVGAFDGAAEHCANVVVAALDATLAYGRLFERERLFKRAQGFNTLCGDFLAGSVAWQECTFHASPEYCSEGGGLG
jgi:hypothetical protein